MTIMQFPRRLSKLQIVSNYS